MQSFTSWNSELYHHGIKGQKWGVRRTLEELGHIAKSSKEGASAMKRLSPKKRRSGDDDPSSMSDDELRKRLSRLNMEKQYRDLTKKDTSRGWEIAERVLTVVGAVTAISVSGMNIYEGLMKKDAKKQ